MTPTQKARKIDRLNEEFLQYSTTDQVKAYQRYYTNVLEQVTTLKKPNRKKVKKIIRETDIKTAPFITQAYSSLLLSGMTNVIEKQNLDKDDEIKLLPIIAILSFYKQNEKLIAKKSQVMSKAIVSKSLRGLNERDKKIYPMFKRYFKLNNESVQATVNRANSQILKIHKQVKSSLSKSMSKFVTQQLNKKVIVIKTVDGEKVKSLRFQTTEEVIGNINERFDKQIDYRVKRVVVTETKQLQEEAKQLHHKTLGYTHKKWNTQMDKRVRDSHQKLQSKIIPIQSKFRVGGSWALYPGDPSLPIEQRINERCYLTYTKRT